MPAVSLDEKTDFGPFLRALRRRAGMTQSELAAAVGFSEAQISRLERKERLPDVGMVEGAFVPALGLSDEPHLATRLVELAATARGGNLPDKSATADDAGRSSATAGATERRSLLTPPTPLLGRERDADQLMKRVLSHSGRLLTLVGPPGIGKSRLALEVARRLSPVFRDGAVFISLAAIDDPGLVCTAIAGELALPDGGPTAPQARLIAYLRHKELLLVLDNFEQVVEAAPAVADLLAACPGLRVIAASRERLHLRAEQRFAVRPLPQEAAVDLFVRCAQASRPEFRLTAAVRPVIEAICAALDHLPLAIELSAARIEDLPPSTLLARLNERRLDLLDDAARDRPPQHANLRAAIWRSYLLLNAAEQRLFRNLSVFIGGFDVAAIDALGYDAGVLQSLIGKSLVNPDSNPYTVPARGRDAGCLSWYSRRTVLVQDGASTREVRRFLLLDTLRDFALERLAESDEEEGVRFRHAAYFLSLTSQMQQTLSGDAKRRWLDRLEAEIYNIRAALRFLIDQDRTQALRMAGSLREFWYIRGYNTEGRQWLAALLAGQPLETHDYAQVLVAAGQLAMAQSDYDEARQLGLAGLDLFRRRGERRDTALALLLLGWIAREVEAHGESYRCFSESLQILREVGDTAHIVQVLTSLAALLGVSGGAVDERRAYLDECTILARESDDKEALAYLLARHGALEMVDGQYRTAAAMLQEAAALFHAMGFKREEAWALEELGEAQILLGELDTASIHLDAARVLFGELGEQLGLMLLEYQDGQIARQRGHLVEAEAHYRRSLRHFATIPHRKTIARCLAGLAAVATANGDWLRAAFIFGAAYRLLDELPPFLPPGETDEYSNLVGDVRASLEPPAFTRLWAEAYAMSTDQAVGVVLSDEPSAPATPCEDGATAVHAGPNDA